MQKMKKKHPADNAPKGSLKTPKNVPPEKLRHTLQNRKVVTYDDMENELSDYILTGRSLNESSYQKYLKRKTKEDVLNIEEMIGKVPAMIKRYKDEQIDTAISQAGKSNTFVGEAPSAIDMSKVAQNR